MSDLPPPTSPWAPTGDEPEVPAYEPVELPTIEQITDAYETRDHPLDPPATP